MCLCGFLFLINKKILIRNFVIRKSSKMKPLKTNKLSNPSEFIKLMVIIFVLVSVFLFSQKTSEDQMIINFVVLGILFFILQLVFVIIYKKGTKTLAFWFLILLGLLLSSSLGALWYFIQLGKAFIH